jgi:hypothetical protein
MTNSDKMLLLYCVLLAMFCAAIGLIYLGYALAGWLA